MYTANYQPLRFLYDCKFLFVVRLKVNKSFPLVLSHLLESVFFEIPILIRFIGALRLLRDRRFPRHSPECKERFSPSATVLLSSIGVHRDCNRNSLLCVTPYVHFATLKFNVIIHLPFTADLSTNLSPFHSKLKKKNVCDLLCK